jgi:thioesterase domain-containing protein
MPVHDRTAVLAAIEAELVAMPPVAALGLRADAYDGEMLRLRAPLAANVNDKGCAFGGSLSSVLTLAAWGLVTARLAEDGLQADVYVADSEVRYKAPLFDDLVAEAVLAEGEDWDAFVATLRQRGRSRITLDATVCLPDGTVATALRGRFVAKRRER